MITPLPKWAKSYDDTWNSVFKDASKEGFDADGATTKAWQDWFDGCANAIQCAPPLPAPPVTGSTAPANFAPLPLKTAKSAPQTAQILAAAWQAWATSITWAPPPPAPPFTAVTTVITSPASVTAAFSTLLSSLTAELSKVPASAADAKLKPLNISKAFYTATISLQVMFIGLGVGSPPPPLQIPVPVY